MFDLPPPPPPPWLEDFQCGSCEQTEEEPSEFADTFYNLVIIVVFSLSMIIILLTLSMFLYRRYKKMYKKKHQNSNINEFQIENNHKFSYTTRHYNQNYYTANVPAVPAVLVPVYETIDGLYYSDISLASSSSSSIREQERESASQLHPPITEL